METAAEGKRNYEGILSQLEMKAKEKNCERWLLSALAQIDNSSGSCEMGGDAPSL